MCPQLVAMAIWAFQCQSKMSVRFSFFCTRLKLLTDTVRDESSYVNLHALEYRITAVRTASLWFVQSQSDFHLILNVKPMYG